MISPNDPGAMKQYVVESQELGIPYIYDPSQQIVRMSSAELCEGIVGAYGIFVNDYEAALVEKMTGMKPEDILARNQQPGRPFVVVTRGEQGATIYARDGAVQIPIVPPFAIVDPTGVGDAFRGGFITAYQNGLDWVTCGRMGALAATYCLENTGPQGHHYTTAEFVARYRRYFEDEGRLDILIEQD